MDQVRTSGGATFAPGCVDENGRMSWPAMQARMGAGRVGATINRRPVPVELEAAQIEDYAPPAAIAGTARGRLYQLLLWLADQDAPLPSGAALMSRLDPHSKDPDQNRPVRLMLAVLQADGLIMMRLAAGRRVLRLVATGQVLRSEGVPDGETI